MFKIISGDFNKTSICDYASIVEVKGFETTKTLLKNAENIRLLSDDEINLLIQNSDYALFVKDLKNTIKNDNMVCLYYKFKNGKEFTAIVDLKTYQLIANNAKEEISEENLIKTSSSKKGCLFIVIVFILFVFVSCIGNHQNNKTSDNNNQPIQNQTENRIKVANEHQVAQLKELLKSGYQIVDESKVYYQKSKDYENAYFIGTMVKHGAELELCMWVTNKEDLSETILSANDGALIVSYPIDARKTKMKVSKFDDGYSAIHGKVLQDFNRLAK